MKNRDRQTTLKLVAGGCLALLLLNFVVLPPLSRHWTEQSERITSLSEKVTRGKTLLEREDSIRKRWKQMQEGDLPKDVTVAEANAYKAVGRWTGASRITFTSFIPAWRSHEEGYETYECRITANGNQASLSRFLYELENDPAPVALQECEITSRDTQGRVLMMNARFSFVRIAENTGSTTTRTRGARQ